MICKIYILNYVIFYDQRFSFLVAVDVVCGLYIFARTISKQNKFRKLKSSFSKVICDNPNKILLGYSFKIKNQSRAIVSDFNANCCQSEGVCGNFDTEVERL